MPERSTLFYTMPLIVLLVILAIFVMKYSVQYLRDRAEAERESDVSRRLDALDAQQGDIEKRVARLEAMLAEVE